MVNRVDEPPEGAGSSVTPTGGCVRRRAQGPWVAPVAPGDTPLDAAGPDADVREVGMLHEVEVEALDPHRLEELVGPERTARFRAAAAAARAGLAGRRVVNVNSTASGRGVAVDARWVVIEGDPAFFEVTKRIHNHLYGSPGDGGPLGTEQRRVYEETLRRNAAELLSFIRAGDIVLLHDPQTAGLAAAVRDAGAHVVWRCHVGRDEPNEATDRAWEFLRPYVAPAERFVFTRAEFAPDWVDCDRLHVI